MQAQAPRPRRLEASARRGEIIEVSTRLIAERGYRGVSLDQIAEACGITKQGLLHHFPSKPELLVAILEHRDEVDLAEAAEHLPRSQTIAGFRDEIRALAQRNLAQPGIVQLYAVLSSEALDPTHPAHEYFRRRLAWSRELLRQGAETWHPDPEGFAIEVLSFMDGLQLNWLRDPTIDFEARAMSFVDRILGEHP
jgi:AcrR family transcriptional regulator